jgi:hypothetical protein
MYLREAVWNGVDWINLVQHRENWNIAGLLWHSNDLSSSIKCGEFY